MITVVGLGTEKGDLTQKGKAAIKKAKCIVSRHKDRRSTACATDICDGATTYEELSSRIAAFLREQNEKVGDVVYIVFGNGYTDGALIYLKPEEYTVIPGVSEYGGKSPSFALCEISAYEARDKKVFDTTQDLMIYQIDGASVAADLKLNIMEWYDAEKEVIFTDKGKSEKLPLCAIDGKKKYYSASLFIAGEPNFLNKKRFDIIDLLDLLDRLMAPDGCPWDRVQTHESIRTSLLEEAYEAVDAIDKKDFDNLEEEIGDVLMQVVFHSNLARKEGEFTLGDVITRLCSKLISRHTHVFGENKAGDALDALEFWEKAKAKEKNCDSLQGQLSRLPDSFPSTFLAQKIIKKSNKAGANITAQDVKEKLKKALNSDDLGTVLALADIYCALLGADVEVEANKKLKEIESKAISLDERGELLRLKDEL
jgi:tetrapyrrole methylase family protein/MazG family protein